MAATTARLTDEFLDKLKGTGLTDSAAAAAIGVTKQYFSQVKLGNAAPSVRFMVGAINAGLAEDFSDVAKVVRTAPESNGVAA